MNRTNYSFSSCFVSIALEAAVELGEGIQLSSARYCHTALRCANEYFVNLPDLSTNWSATSEAKDVFEGRDSETGGVNWTGTCVDLICGSNSELRAIAEVYGCQDSQEKFVQDFAAACPR